MIKNYVLKDDGHQKKDWKTHISLRVEQETIDRLSEASDQTGLNRSEIIIGLIDMFLSKFVIRKRITK